MRYLRINCRMLRRGEQKDFLLDLDKVFKLLMGEWQ